MEFFIKNLFTVFAIILFSTAFFTGCAIASNVDTRTLLKYEGRYTSIEDKRTVRDFYFQVLTSRNDPMIAADVVTRLPEVNRGWQDTGSISGTQLRDDFDGVVLHNQKSYGSPGLWGRLDVDKEIDFSKYPVITVRDHLKNTTYRYTLFDNDEGWTQRGKQKRASK